MTTAPTSDVAQLTATERCDRCDARAYVRSTFMAGEKSHDLLWCAHHFAANEAKIRATAAQIDDERYQLTA